MRLEDICETSREKRVRRLLYQERFGIPVDKEPLIGVVGIGKVAKIYCTLLTSHMDFFLYKPKICLVGRGEKESDFKRRHLDHETKLLLDKDRVFPMNYQDFSSILNNVDLVFVTLGADTNKKDRESMYKSSLKTMGPLLNLPWNVFPGLIDILTNPSEVIAQKILKEIQKSGGLKDPRQMMCNGPLDLWRIQYVIRDWLDLEVEPHKIRVSVGGNHPNPYVSLENVLVEQGLSSSGISIYRDITQEVQELNELLKKDGTSIVKEAQKIPYSSFNLQEGYGGLGTPTDISTAASMVELTHAIINRFDSTAVSILEGGIFKYKKVYFKNGFPEQDEERVQSFSIKDLREIEKRDNGSRKSLRKHLGSDYEINIPSSTHVLEAMFCPRGRQEPEELEEIIITEFDDGTTKSRRNSHSPPLREMLKRGIHSGIYIRKPYGNSITSYIFNRSLNPKVLTLSLVQTLDERELKKTQIKDFVYSFGKVIGLTQLSHINKNDEYRFIIWDVQKANPELLTDKFDIINGKSINKVNGLSIWDGGTKFGFESKGKCYLASYSFSQDSLQILFDLPDIPFETFEFQRKTLSVCNGGIFVDTQNISPIGVKVNGWVNLAKKSELLFYSTNLGLYVTDLNQRDSTVVTAEGYANDVLEYSEGIQTVTFVNNLGILVSEYNSTDQVFEGRGHERVIQNRILDNPNRIIIQNQNLFFVLGNNCCYAVYHQDNNHYVSRLPFEKEGYLGVEIYGI